MDERCTTQVSTDRIRREAAVVLLSALLIVLGFLALLSALNSPLPFRYLTRGTYPGRPPLPPPTLGPVGINLPPSALDDTAFLEQLQASGMRLIRVKVFWKDIEPRPGEYRWQRWDRRMRQLRTHGLVPILVIDTSPAWARAPEDQTLPWAPPAHAEAIVPFLTQMATRYGAYVDAYQIWDEPNIAPHWGHREADPMGYVRLLQVAAIAIKRVDAQALIISAGLAPTLDPGRVNRNDLAYLQAMLSLGAGTWFDVLAWEPYGFNEGPEAPPSPARLNFRRVEEARTLLDRYGLTNVPIWATAFGWNAPRDGRPTPWGAVSPTRQAQNARHAMRWVARHAPWLQVLIWAHARPDAPPDDPLWGFALWTPTGMPRPVWQALVQAQRQQPSSRLKARVFPEGRPVPELPGRRGRRRTFVFRGTGVRLTVQTGPRWHTLWVEIDGRPAPSLPHTPDGRAYLNLYSPEVATLDIIAADHLPFASHHLTLISGPGDPVWPVLAVTPVRTPEPLAVRVLLGILGGGLLLPAWALRRRRFNIGLTATPLSPWETRSLLLTVAFIPFTARLVHLNGVVLVLPEIPLLAILISKGIAWMRGMPPLRVASARRSRGSEGVLLWGGAFFLALFLFQIMWVADVPALWVAVRGTILFPLLLYLLLRHSPVSARVRAVRALMWGTVVLAIVALTGAFQGQVVWAGSWPRIRAFFGSPNHLALVLVRVLPFTLLPLASPSLAPLLWGTQVSRKISGSPLGRGIPAGLLLLVLFLTGSRGAWVLGVPALVMVFYGSNRARGGWMIMITTLLIGVAFVLLRGWETLGRRVLIWQGSVRLLADAPWTGVGPGQFPWMYPRYALPTAWKEPHLYHAHDVFLSTALALGLPAALFLTIVLIRVLWSFSRPGVGHNDLASPLRRAARASLWGGLAFGLVDAFWSLPDLAYLSALALALLAPASVGEK